MTKEIKARMLAVKEFPYSKLIDLQKTDELREALIIGYTTRDKKADGEILEFIEWAADFNYKVFKGMYYDSCGDLAGTTLELLKLFKNREV